MKDRVTLIRNIVRKELSITKVTSVFSTKVSNKTVESRNWKKRGHVTIR